jgi:hypothetical protein
MKSVLPDQLIHRESCVPVFAAEPLPPYNSNEEEETKLQTGRSVSTMSNPSCSYLCETITTILVIISRVQGKDESER